MSDSGDAFGAGLGAVALAALSRAVTDAARRVEQLARNLARINAATSRPMPANPAPPGTIPAGSGFASSGRAGDVQGQVIASAMAANSAKLTALVAAVDRNTQALRQVATLSGVSAAAGVVRTVQTAAVAGQAAGGIRRGAPRVVSGHTLDSQPTAAATVGGATAAASQQQASPKRRRTRAENARLDAMEFALTPDEQVEDAKLRAKRAEQDQRDGASWESLPEAEREQRRQERDKRRAAADLARRRRRAAKRLAESQQGSAPAAVPTQMATPTIAPGAEVTEPYPTPPGPQKRRKRGGGPQTPSEDVPLTPLEQGPAQATEAVTYPQATETVTYPQATEVTGPAASPGVQAIEAEIAQAEREFAANEERLRQQREKKGAGTERGQAQAARNAQKRQEAHNERLAEMRSRMEAAQQAAAQAVPPMATPVPTPPSGIPIEPPPTATPLPGPVNVLPPPNVPGRSIPPGQAPRRRSPYQPAIPVAGNAAAIPVPGGLPPIPPPPSGGPPVAGGGPGGGIPELIAALKANTDATVKNTAAMGVVTAQAKQSDGGIIERVERRRNWLGRMDDTRDRLQNLSGATGAAAGAGAAGIVGLVSAISPSAISTLTGSFQMLAGEIGKSFVPAVYQAAYGLQDIARWVGGLDDGMKVGLARITTYAVVGLGGLSIASRLAAASIGLATGASRLFTGTLSVIAAHPVVLTIGAITAGVITMTGQWENLGTVAGRALGIMADGAANVVRGIGGINLERKPTIRELVAPLPADAQERIAKAGQKSPEEAKKAVAALMEENRKAVEEARGLLLPEEQIEQKLTRQRQKVIDMAVAERYTPEYQAQRKVWEGLPEVAKYDEFGKPRIPAPDRMGDAFTATIESALSKAKGLGLDLTREEVVRGMPSRLGFPGELVPSEGIRPRENRVQARMQQIEELERRGNVLKSIQEQVGNDKDRLRNTVMPFQSRFTDAMNFMESVQLQSMNVGDLDANNAQERMEQAIKDAEKSSTGLLTEINRNLKALEDAVGRLRWWGGR